MHTCCIYHFRSRNIKTHFLAVSLAVKYSILVSIKFSWVWSLACNHTSHKHLCSVNIKLENVSSFFNKFTMCYHRKKNPKKFCLINVSFQTRKNQQEGKKKQKKKVQRLKSSDFPYFVRDASWFSFRVYLR